MAQSLQILAVVTVTVLRSDPEPSISVLMGSGAKERLNMTLLRNFWNDDSGQGLVEYALIIALVAIGLILALLFLRNAIGNIFVDISDELNNAPAQQFSPT